jgi:hypothetical protein
MIKHQGATSLEVFMATFMLQELLAVAAEKAITDPAGYRYL